ncbi:AAA domain protein [Yasminevirus sp. GU-2018]|uniref:AAA domain protein n=1 Tax=Yasminevirus sp. GU-2018 TaxID=2420051 RepID=A0A5K0UB23_9VIRU|nr:AAA domain protein [Yasminevirus sp. GU-2018]
MLDKIIVITGVSGSGKSTLGEIIRHRFKDVYVVDTDDVDDSSFLELYYHNDEFRKMVETDTGEPQKIHEELNKQKRDAIIKDYKGKKTLVFVGMTLMFADIEHIGYFLDTPVEFNHKQVNKRTLHDICKNASKIEDVLNDDTERRALDLMTLCRFKIRHKFPISYKDVKKSYERFRDASIKKSYKIMTAKEIVADLSSFLTPIYVKNKGSHNLIIHVSGVQGSGKTHMGSKLQMYYGDIVHIKDLDDLYSEFSSTDSTNYQAFIDEFILKHKDKPIIFVGLDAELCLDPRNKTKESESSATYNLHAEHKFFIDEADHKILQQRFFRQIQKMNDRREEFFEMWTESPEKMQEKLIRYVDISGWANNNRECRDLHVKRGYKLLSYDDIIESIRQIMQNLPK